MIIPLRLFSIRGPIILRNFNRTCASNTNIKLESNIQYPKYDKRFGHYLDSLGKKTNINDKKSFVLREITRQYEYRKNIIAQLIELHDTMSNEPDEELLKLGAEELAVILMIIF